MLISKLKPHGFVLAIPLGLVSKTASHVFECLRLRLAPNRKMSLMQELLEGANFIPVQTLRITWNIPTLASGPCTDIFSLHQKNAGQIEMRTVTSLVLVHTTKAFTRGHSRPQNQKYIQIDASD